MEETNNSDDLNLSSEEAFRLKNAFKNKDFLKLFHDYIENINKPESREQYEKEITAMEKERGFEVKFIHPDPLYVMKFNMKGMKLFINICKNQHVRETVFERKNSGTACQIPVILSKPREDLDKKGEKCTVVDVMFHPKTMELAEQNRRFRKTVEETAISTVQNQFKFDNLQEAKYPKLKYKGCPPSLILRQNHTGLVCEPLKEYCTKLMAEKKLGDSTVVSNQCCNQMKQKVPKYSIKYRDVIDMKDFSLMGYTDKTAPKAILLDIHLPDVKSASEIDVDVSEKKFHLVSKRTMHNYRLDLDFSYSVDENGGTAKFDKTTKVLNVILPVKDRGIPNVKCCSD